MTIEKGELATPAKKEVKTKFINLDDAGNDKLLHWLLLSLSCWLMLARKLCVWNAGLIVDMSWEILTVAMISYYEIVCWHKRHTVVRHAFCFWWFALLFLGFVTKSWWYTATYNKYICVMTIWLYNTLDQIYNSFESHLLFSCNHIISLWPWHFFSNH